VESDYEDEKNEQGYDFHQAYTNDQGSEDVEEDGGDDRRRRHRARASRSSSKASSSKHHRSGRSSRGRRGKYAEAESEKSDSEGEEEEEDVLTVGAESFPSSKYDEIETLGCQALAPLDFLIRPGRVFRACKEEVTGAAADTTSAFDQVCNVFTLKGSELNAVFNEIEGARRELSPDEQQEAKSRKKRSDKDTSSKRSAAKSKSGRSGKSKARTRSRSSSRRRS
jgi:hypothetical protein